MIGIIGGGPIGCYLGSLVDCKVFEEHSEIGNPVQCTGLVTSEIFNFVKKDDFVVNELSDFRIKSGNEKVELKLKKNYLLDRKKFDRYLMEKVLDRGNEVFFDSKYKSYGGNMLDVGKKFKIDNLVGADGVFSRVRNDFFEEKKYIRGVQARIKGKFDQIIDVELGNGFSWIVPENEEIARVGYLGESNILEGKEVLEWQGGFIPVYDRKFRISNGNKYLVGDAAGMVKANTHGGLVPGLVGARELGKVLKKGGNYDKMFRKKIGKDLDKALLVRNILDKFSSNDYEELIRLSRGNKVKNILESYNRDYLNKFFWKIMINEPKFLKFFLKVF